MAIGQRERRELQEALMKAIGAEPTDSLMEYLPPVGWADVATKHDLDGVTAILQSKVDRLEGKLDTLATKDELLALRRTCTPSSTGRSPSW